jgi:hypothetical protein
MEIITIIMTLMVNSLQLGIYCYTDHYYILMNGFVYGIPHESIELTHQICTQLYKVPNMDHVKKMMTCNTNVYYLTHNNDVYVKYITPIKSSIATLVTTNIIDINFDSKRVYMLTDKHELICDDKVILSNVIQFSCGKLFTIAITTKGCYSWGTNAAGQLGLGDRNYRGHPTLLNLDAKKVACGKYQAAAICQNGVYIWGYNNNHDYQSPHKLPLRNIIDIQCSSSYTIFLNKNNNAFICGKNDLKTINISNIIMIAANKKAIMLMTKSLKIYTLHGPIFQFKA